MKIAAAMLTCDRIDYTETTVSSFRKFHPDLDWSCFYLDDASEDPESIRSLMAGHGFAAVTCRRDRRGCTPSTHELVRRVVAHVPDVDLLLYLQNDFEFMRPIPVDLVTRLFTEDAQWGRRLGCFRLAGRWQDPGKVQMHERWFRPTKWYRIVEPAMELEIGQAPFVYNPPSILRPDLFLYFLDGSFNEKAVAKRSDSIPFVTIRPAGNITRHIGVVRTPGGKFGK